MNVHVLMASFVPLGERIYRNNQPYHSFCGHCHPRIFFNKLEGFNLFPERMGSILELKIGWERGVVTKIQLKFCPGFLFPQNFSQNLEFFDWPFSHVLSKPDRSRRVYLLSDCLSFIAFLFHCLLITISHLES